MRDLTRIVIQGETVREWLLLSIDPRSPGLVSWQGMQVGGGA